MTRAVRIFDRHQRVSSLPPSDLGHCGHHLSVRQAAPEDVVSRDVLDHAKQGGDLVAEIGPPLGHFAEQCLVAQAQTDAGHAGAGVSATFDWGD